MAQLCMHHRVMRRTPTVREVAQTVINLRAKLEGRTYVKYANWPCKKWKKISTRAIVNIRFASSATKSRLMKKRESVQTVTSITIRRELRNTSKVELTERIRMDRLIKMQITTGLSSSRWNTKKHMIETRNHTTKSKFNLSIRSSKCQPKLNNVSRQKLNHHLQKISHHFNRNNLPKTKVILEHLLKLTSKTKMSLNKVRSKFRFKLSKMKSWLRNRLTKWLRKSSNQIKVKKFLFKSKMKQYKKVSSQLSQVSQVSQFNQFKPFNRTKWKLPYQIWLILKWII